MSAQDWRDQVYRYLAVEFDNNPETMSRIMFFLDSVKMLHIYHFNRSIVKKDNHFKRIFCDPKTGWSYVCGRNEVYKRYLKVLPNIN